MWDGGAHLLLCAERTRGLQPLLARLRRAHALVDLEHDGVHSFRRHLDLVMCWVRRRQLLEQPLEEERVFAEPLHRPHQKGDRALPRLLLRLLQDGGYEGGLAAQRQQPILRRHLARAKVGKAAEVRGDALERERCASQARLHVGRRLQVCSRRRLHRRQQRLCDDSQLLAIAEDGGLVLAGHLA